jgi:hypothetical protein
VVEGTPRDCTHRGCGCIGSYLKLKKIMENLSGQLTVLVTNHLNWPFGYYDDRQPLGGTSTLEVDETMGSCIS